MKPHATEWAARRTADRTVRLGYLPAAVLILSLCSCSSSRNQVTGDPFVDESGQVAVNAIEETPAGAVEPVETAIHEETTQLVSNKRRQNAAGGNILQMSAHAPGAAMDQYCPAPMPGMQGGPALFAPVGPAIVAVEEEASQAKYPDEYIYDGGDRATSVHHTGYGMSGLDPEDAIAEYRDDLGVRHIKESNRVAVYSPRFAAVSVISTLNEEVDIDRAAGSKVSEFGVNYYNRTGTIAQQENLSTEGVRVRSRASELDRDLLADAVDVPQSIAENSKLINLFEDYQFIATGELVQDEVVVIGEAVQAAEVWSQKQYPVVAARTSGANEVYNTLTAQELASPDEIKGTKGRIRVVKLADKHVAVKGDIVTFTIRYDNIGDRPVSNVVIIDNLTVRLSYVDGTAESDRKGKFITEDNGAGSLILRWELDEPLAGGEGGVVTFQSRVE